MNVEKRAASTPWYGNAVSPLVKAMGGDSALVPGLIFLVLALGVGAIGLHEYRTQAEVMRARAERDIGAIAEIKTQQITQWLAERRAHAASIMADPSLASDVREFMRQGTRESPAGARIGARLAAAQGAYGYVAVVLLDHGGRRHLQSGSVESLPARELELAGEALRRKDVVLSELHWDQSAGRRFVSLEIFAPLLVGADPGQEAVGVVYFDADVSKDLYPLIQGWLTPGGSAEALLIRREGDQIVYLNELRHRPRGSLSLGTPAGERPQVGALALTKGDGTYRGLDYRGVEVLAAARSVPGTAWMMVARVDAAEVSAPIVALATRVSVVVGVLILVGGAATGLWWRNHRARNELEKFRLQVEKHAISMHYDFLTRYANDMILLMDGSGRIVDANDRAVETYGFPRPQLIGMPLAALQAPASDADADGGTVQWTPGGRIYEALHRRGDGTVFPVEVSARLFEISGKSYRQAIIRDITERRRAEQDLRRREQEYMALAEHSPDIIARADRARRYLYVNARIEAATGLERGRFIGKTNAELDLPPGLSDPWERAIEATLRTGREQRFDFTVASPGGELLYEARMVPEFDPAGEVQTVLCVARDVTAPHLPATAPGA